MNRVEIKNKAKELMKGNIWKIFGILFLVAILSSLVSEIIVKLFATIGINLVYVFEDMKIDLISGVIEAMFSFGTTNYLLKFVRGENPTINDIFNILSKLWLPIILATLLVSLNISIGSILLIVPGIIAAVGLSFYAEVIIDDKENKNVIDNLKDAWNLTKGYKGDIVVFGLSFIGWILLCVFFFPIIYVIPYIAVSEILYYEELKKLKHN